MNLPDFKLERFFAKHEFSAKHLLCSSDCEAMSISDLLEFEPKAEERFKATWLGYTESSGDPALRKAISSIYDSIDPDNTLVFTGAQEAILLFVHSFLGPDDHAIVHSPCYQSLFEIAQQVTGNVDRWNAQPDRDWQLDLDELESLIRPNTKVIIVNTPHNPTGYLMSHADWKSLHQLAERRGIVVFCDEVYRESEHLVEDKLVAGCDLSESAVSLGVMSKSYGLAGLRIGWVATRNADVLQGLKRMKDYTTICNSAPSEFLAELGLRHRQRLVDRNLGIIRANLDLLDTFFQEFDDLFGWTRPRAGSIAFPEYHSGNADEFCQTVLESTGVLLAPSSMFEFSGQRFRIGFGRSNMKAGLDVLAEFLRTRQG
jgi:aspartate/methionine/tyrosine aminotransferase